MSRQFITAAGPAPRNLSLRFTFERGDGFYIANHCGGDIGEGPWTTRDAAEEFRDAEVGTAGTQVVEVSNGKVLL